MNIPLTGATAAEQESVWGDLEKRIGQLVHALKTCQRENDLLKQQREVLLTETTRLHDEVLRWRGTRQEALGRVSLLHRRLQELERHVKS